MDPISISFYAIICGLLALVAPSLKGVLPRLAIGAFVGVAAALALPMLKDALAISA